MTKDYSRIHVYGALVIGLIAFGFAPILVRFATDTPPIVLVTYRTVFAALFLLPYWWVKREPRTNDEASKKERKHIALAGVCLGLHFTCWIASLYYTSVASASVLVTIHPILIILVERFLFKRSFATTTWLGVMLAFVGSALLGIFDSHATQEFTNPLFGNFLAFTAAAIFVVYLLIGQKIRQRREWIDYVFPVYGVAALTCLTLAIVTGQVLTNISDVGIWAAIGMAIGPQIFGHGSMNLAVKFISPTLLSTLILTEALLASVLAFFFFAEVPPVLSIFAMVVIMGGVGLTWKRKTKD